MTHRTLILAFTASLSAQQIVTTFAGTEWVFPGDGRPALDAPLSTNLSATVDPQGRLVFADELNHVVARIEPSGTVTGSSLFHVGKRVGLSSPAPK